MDERRDLSLERVFRCLEIYREGREGSLLQLQTFLVAALREPISPVDMLPILRSGPQSVSTALARLAAYDQRKTKSSQLGLVRMDPHPDNRRSKLVSLTPVGAELLTQMRKTLGEIDRQG